MVIGAVLMLVLLSALAAAYQEIIQPGAASGNDNHGRMAHKPETGLGPFENHATSSTSRSKRCRDSDDRIVEGEISKQFRP